MDFLIFCLALIGAFLGIVGLAGLFLAALVWVWAAVLNKFGYWD
jgi:hypothetical protein